MKGVIVENVRVKSIPFFDSSRPCVKKCLEYIKSTKLGNGLDLADLEPEQELRFVLKKSCSSFANALRRCFIEEIPVKSFSVAPSNIQTDDQFILYEEIIEHLTSIPISQDITFEEMETWVVSVNVHNKNDNIMTVYSNDIQISNGKKAIGTKKIFSPTIPICVLHPGKFIRITKIFISTKKGYEDGKHIIMKNPYYKILDMEPFVPVKSAGPSPYQHTGTSCLEQDPTQFEIGFTTHRTTESSHVMLLCCDTLAERLINIKKHMETFLEEKKDMPYNTTKITLSVKDNLVHLEMFDEYYTLAKLVSHYCYIVKPDIHFVAHYLYHPLIRNGYVKISRESNNPIQIFVKAIEEILKDLNTVRDAFKDVKVKNTFP